jgi:hypothetical protein
VTLILIGTALPVGRGVSGVKRSRPVSIVAEIAWYSAASWCWVVTLGTLVERRAAVRATSASTFGNTALVAAILAALPSTRKMRHADSASAAA